MTAGLPRSWQVAIDWVVTIAAAIGLVIAIKAWVVNPYKIPSASMEPTLHCARPGAGCESRFSDRVLANRFIYRLRDPHRGEIVVFKTPPAAKQDCGEGGIFVKRLIGLPREIVHEDKQGFIWIGHKKLDEPYIQQKRRDRTPSTGRRSGACRPGGTSSWATTAGTRATRGAGARCRART
jgi:signal peptidase I